MKLNYFAIFFILVVSVIVASTILVMRSYKTDLYFDAAHAESDAVEIFNAAE